MVDKTYFLVSGCRIPSILLPTHLFLLAEALVNALVKHFRILTYENPSIKIKNSDFFRFFFISVSKTNNFKR